MADPKELNIDTSMVQDDIAADPGLEQAVKHFTTSMRQAFDAVQRGQYASIDEALAALGVRAVKVDTETGEEIEGATLQRDLTESGLLDSGEPLSMEIAYFGEIEKDDDEGSKH